MSRYFSGLAHHMPSGYRMSRRFESTNWPNFSVGTVDFRTAAWWGGDVDTDAATRTAAMARGEAKLVRITVDSGVVQSADENPGEAGDQLQEADSTSNFDTNEHPFMNRKGQSRIYVRTPSGAASFEIEVFYDVPPAETV